MGDRGNVIIKDGKEQVCLYTHWGGSGLPEVVRKALARKLRWDDPQYLARIIFCEMIPVKMWNAETGFGISQTVHDQDGNQCITLNMDERTVQMEGLPAMSFEEYIKAPVEW